MRVAPKSLNAPTLSDADQEKFSTLDIVELTDRLEVMRKQEDTTYVCSGYLKKTTSSTMIDELYRTKMLTWILQVLDFCKFKRETVVIAMSYLDLFLSSGTPRAMDAIKNRKEYQLASMTTLYMAIKLYEPVGIDTNALALLSRNTYEAKDFARMEFDILCALKWRVHGPTVLTFLEYFMAIISPRPMRKNTGLDTLIHICKQYIELTLGDYYFVTKKPSTVAIAVLSTGLRQIPIEKLSETDRLTLFSKIATATKIDLTSQEICSSIERLASITGETGDFETRPMPAILCKISTNPTRFSRISRAALHRIILKLNEACVQNNIKIKRNVHNFLRKRADKR